MSTSGSPEFDKLKEHLDSNKKVRTEVEFAFSSLLTAANPSDRGLRFLFGSGAEWIIAAAAWSAGILVAPAGHNTDGFDLGDLLDDSRSLWSIKASASRTSSQIRLINFMGDGTGAEWVEPTVFVGPYLHGAVYMNPTLDSSLRSLARHGSDALILAGKAVKEHSEAHPENHIDFDVAVNRGADNNDPYAFIKSVLDEEHFPELSAPFVASEPKRDTSYISQIEAFVRLRDKGDITSKQFDAFINKLVGK